MDLTAADVHPFFEDQKFLGRIPTSDFSPHVFDKEQELPLTLPTDLPRDDLPTAPVVSRGEIAILLDIFPKNIKADQFETRA